MTHLHRREVRVQSIGGQAVLRGTVVVSHDFRQWPEVHGYFRDRVQSRFAGQVEESAMSLEWVTTTTILHDLKDDAQSEAWTQLVTRFQRPIAGFARSMGLSAVDAEEVAQETLLAFLNNYRDGKYDRDRGRLNKWLFGIAYRQALRQRRKAAGREVLICGNESQGGFWNELPDEDAATECFDRQWEQALLDECLQRARVEFEPATFRAFELTVQQGNAALEAAAALNLPVKAVYNAKHRVLKRIRELRADLAEVDP